MFREELKNFKAYSIEPFSHQVKLNQNESPYDIPPALKEKILRKLQGLEWNRYPTPFADRLRQAVAEKEQLKPDQIITAGGSNTLIHFLVLAASLGGRVLTLSPSFPVYTAEAKGMGNEVIGLPLNAADFSMPTDQVISGIKNQRPNIVFISNPNAPTGNLFPENDLTRVVQTAASFDIPVVIDEAYYPFSGATLLPKLNRYPNLIILRTLSKAFSLAGLRVGLLFASEKITSEVRKVTPPFLVGALQETVALTVLQNQGYVSKLVEEIKKEREVLFDGMKKIPGVTPFPSSANFILFKVPNGMKTCRSLAEKGVLIRPMGGEGLENHLRVTVGTPEENRLFLKTLSSSTP